VSKMSTTSIFRQLTTGVSFNKKRFSIDAAKFGLTKSDIVTKTDSNTVQLPSFPSIKAQLQNEVAKDKDAAQNDLENEDITLLGNIKSTRKKKEKKKLKKTKTKAMEIYQEKINQFRNSYKISTNGTDIPDPFNDWDVLKERYQVSDTVLENIKHGGFTTPTPVQMQAIPVMLESREVLSCAPTGSGKTVAFLLPLIHHLKEPRKGGYRAVVVVPTRELALQINRECVRLCEKTGLRSHCLGKVKGGDETPKVSSPKFDILITPPNRLVYLLQHDPPLVSLDKVKWLVVDEADKLFEAGVSGFREQLSTIYRSCSGAEVRRAMFSATLGPEVENWARLNLDNMVKVRVGAANSATDTVDQQLLYCGSEHGKLVAFRDLVRQGIQPPVLVFVQTKERAQELFKELLYDDIYVDVIHADRSQQQRENTVRAFRSGGIWVLICTELMGRGIDFKGVNLVINYDFPPSAVSYIHRIGRTGRAGRSGRAVTFFTEEDRTILRTIAQVMRNSGCEVPEYMLHMKKPTRDKRKDLEKRAPKREGIATESQYDKNKRMKLQQMVTASKKRKAKESGETGEPGKKRRKISEDETERTSLESKSMKKDFSKVNNLNAVKKKKKRRNKEDGGKKKKTNVDPLKSE